MRVSKYLRNWMSLAGILFRFAVCAAGNSLVFDYGELESAATPLPYRFAEVGGVDGNKPSLVIYLHGGSSTGVDNETQMLEAGIDSIADYLVAKRLRAIFVVPQCPAEKSWGAMTEVLKELVEYFKQRRGVDENRVYLLGGSMGGTGTWSMLSAYPRLFAAAMPVAGNPSRCDVLNVSLTPVITVMGTSDRIMNVETTSDFVDGLRKVGGECMFDIVSGWNHEMTCIRSYSTSRLDWVFAHRLNAAGMGIIDTDNMEIICEQSFSLDGTVSDDAELRGFHIIRTIYRDGTIRIRKSYR